MSGTAGTLKRKNTNELIMEIAEQSRSRQCTYVGTPCYMAPEMKETEREIDERCDVWSYGCVVYKIITGNTLIEDDKDLNDMVDDVKKALTSLPTVML